MLDSHYGGPACLITGHTQPASGLVARFIIDITLIYTKKDMDLLKQVIAQKRKQIEDITIDNNGSKCIRTADMFRKEKDAYFERQKELDKNYKTANDLLNTRAGEDLTSLESTSQVELPRPEVILRLRSRAAPILLFGETDADALRRLRKLEMEQPELKEGWKNDFQTALTQVDNDLVEEVIKGNKDEVGKHDVQMPDIDTSWDQIAQRANLLGEGDDANRDCDIIREFLVYLLKRWGRELNARDEAEKRSPKGKMEAGMHKQTMEQLRPLISSFEKYTCNSDIRIHLVHICRLCIIEKDYIRANNAYMEMAIGNAPWPVGVTRSGIHQRPGSSKAYVSNVAHVLNDETQRKYIHGLKRLMSKCQYYFPADPSKCVEYCLWWRGTDFIIVISSHSENQVNMEVDSNEESYIPEAYVEFMDKIAACRESGDQHELAKLREEFSEQFPLLPSIWLSWIEDEIEKGADQKTVESLFDRAIADFHSSQVCAKYIEWACGIDMAFAREKLEQIVGIIGLRPDSADIVWESYLDIVEAEYCMLVNEDDCNTQKCIAKNQLKTLFDRALRVPHQRLAEIYERYLEFLGEEEGSPEMKAALEASQKAYAAVQKT
uniref:Pre-mRNA-splicing factor 18 n=1 Tax=Ditylenchus dipsaci TaxID=166011 RepID=A0A915DH35_9BILA